MATFSGLQSRLPLNLTHLLSPRSYLTQRVVSQLHSSACTQRFWTLLYHDNNKPLRGDETPSRHQRKQCKREKDVVTSDRYGPPPKNLVVRADEKYIFVRDDVALPITNVLRAGFYDDAVVERSADKLREELPSWRKLKSRQDPYEPRWKPSPSEPYDPCRKPCPPPSDPVPKRKTIPTYNPTDPCRRRSPKPTTCRRASTLCGRKSRYYLPVGLTRWSRRNWSSLAVSPTGSITRLSKNQLLAEYWRTQNSGIHVSVMTSGRRSSGNHDSGSGENGICTRGTKKKKNKKNKKKKKKKKKKPKVQEGRTICTGGKADPRQICTTPRNNPGKVSNSSPRNDVAEVTNRASVPETPRQCGSDAAWKKSTCPGFAGGPGTCSTNKPGCGSTDVPLSTASTEERRQDEKVNAKRNEHGEEKKKDKETQEKPKDPCNSDWCPGKSSSTCSTNKPQCPSGGTSRRSYSTAVIRPREYKTTKLPFIPTRSIGSSGLSYRERKDSDKTNPQNIDDIVKKEFHEIEECITSVRCPRPKKTGKSDSGENSGQDKK